jgi:hypothetical protein
LRLLRQDVFDLIEEHFAARQALASIDAALEQQEVAFRNIQKRLLVRYKVGVRAVPSPLHTHTHTHVAQLCDHHSSWCAHVRCLCRTKTPRR